MGSNVGASSCKSDQSTADEPEPLDLYRNRGALSIVTVSWLAPLLKLGYSRPLLASDLPPICAAFSAESLKERLDAVWRARIARGATVSQWCFFYALLEAFGGSFALAGLLKFVSDACALISPLVLRAIVADVRKMDAARQWADIYPGLLLCGLIFVLQMTHTIVVNAYFTLTMQGGLRVRTATAALIYQKSLCLSGKARQEFTTGKIVNLLSSDTERLDKATSYLHYMWSGPLQIIVIVAFLFELLGWAAIVGFAFLLILIPIQSKIIRKLSGYRKETSTTTDKRVRLMQEIIQGIRVIKFYAWERCFLGKLDELREKELGRVKRTLTIRTLTIMLTMVASTFSCILTFVSFYLLGNELTSEVVFPTLAFFALLGIALRILPMVVTMTVDGSVAVKRIRRFLLADELDFVPTVLSGLTADDKESGLAADAKEDSRATPLGLFVSKGSFVWESAPCPPPPSPLVSSKGVAARKAGRGKDGAAGDGPTDRSVESAKLSPTQEKGAISDFAIQKSGGDSFGGGVSGSEQGSRPLEEEGEPMALHDINIRIKRGALVAIVGPVGSGKSSLLNALVGELKALCGDAVVQFGGRVAYCPQQAWIQNGTVRENILFGRPYERSLYKRIVRACALVSDFEMLPDGDSTEIGEKGVNVSGGQKQRISLARAAYSSGQVVLLDDPLSAVDAHVGRHLFKHCIGGVMNGTTRILVTHQLYILPKFDHIILMEGGRITAQGTFDELMQSTPAFNHLMHVHGEIHDEDEEGASGNGECSSRPQSPAQALSVNPSEDGMSPGSSCAASPLLPHCKAAIPRVESSGDGDGDYNKGGEGKITKAEERFVGSVSGRVYKEYAMAAGGFSFAILCIASVLLLNSSRIATDLWVTQWTSDTPYFEVSNTTKIVVYLLLGLSQGIFAVINGITFALGSVRASRTFHSRAARRLLSAPVAFFDTNPTGRIMSRFSKDLDTLDNMIVETTRMFAQTLAMVGATYLTLVIVNWVLVFPLALLIPFYLFIQNYYRRSSRELKRIEGLARSPMYAQFSETLTGLSTIRAFGQQERFQRRNMSLMNVHNSAAFVQLAVQRWLGLRLEVFGNVILLGVSSFCYLLPISSALTGLAIQYTMSVSGPTTWCLRQATELETQIISVERLSYYASQLAVERDDMLCSASAPCGTRGNARASDESLLTEAAACMIPLAKISCGRIEMRSVTMRYRPELEPVLTDMTISIRSGERIGIVGRTGAGKSSIVLALFRIIAPSSGAILIDGVDIATMTLPELRSSISIIPQDPVVFATTIRWNLDPHGRFTDDQLWRALDRAHLRLAVQHMDGRLDAMVHEGGENMSVGQRQLLCLARAILCDNRILVLDEATANVDMETDALIQESIRRDFGGATILTIAHRIKTVIDYDRILVLDKGRVVEFDSPGALLANTGSLFYSLASEGDHGDAEEAIAGE